MPLNQSGHCFGSFCGCTACVPLHSLALLPSSNSLYSLLLSRFHRSISRSMSLETRRAALDSGSIQHAKASMSFKDKRCAREKGGTKGSQERREKERNRATHLAPINPFIHRPVGMRKARGAAASPLSLMLLLVREGGGQQGRMI